MQVKLLRPKPGSLVDEIVYKGRINAGSTPPEIVYYANASIHDAINQLYVPMRSPNHVKDGEYWLYVLADAYTLLV